MRAFAIVRLACAFGLLATITAQDPPPPPPPAPAKPAAPTAAADQPNAPPYRAHDLAKVFVIDKVGDHHTATIDPAGFTALLADLEANALNYPPRFRKADERQIATREATAAGKVLATVLRAEPGAEPPVAMLLLAGRLEAAAHNLEVPGASNRAIGYFERALRAEPDSIDGNFRFGAFLGGTATKQKEALPYLEKAVKLGETRALYPLGMTQLMLGDKAAALTAFESYLGKHPEDAGAKDLVTALRSGDTKIERKVDGKPVDPPKAK